MLYFICRAEKTNERFASAPVRSNDNRSKNYNRKYKNCAQSL